MRAKELWRVDADHLAAAQDDATLLAIRAQERAGLDAVTDGEIRRESYSRRSVETAQSNLDPAELDVSVRTGTRARRTEPRLDRSSSVESS